MKSESLSRKKEIKQLYTLSSPKVPDDGIPSYVSTSGRRSRNEYILPAAKSVQIRYSPTKYPWEPRTQKERELVRTYKQQFNL